MVLYCLSGIIEDSTVVASLQKSLMQTFISESASAATRKKGTLDEKIAALAEMYTPVVSKAIQGSVMHSFEILYRLIKKELAQTNGHLDREITEFEASKKTDELFLAFLGTDFWKPVMAGAKDANTRRRLWLFFV